MGHVEVMASVEEGPVIMAAEPDDNRSFCRVVGTISVNDGGGGVMLSSFDEVVTAPIVESATVG